MGGTWTSKPLLKNSTRSTSISASVSRWSGGLPPSGKSPTILGSAPKGATDHLAALERKGWIERVAHSSRGIQLVEEEVGIPVLGKVAAGHPILAQENLLGHLNFTQLFGLRDRFAVQVVGDSMEKAGIQEGDYVIVQKAQDFRDGDIVVALLDGEATCKRIFRQTDGSVRLQPENDRHRPILVDATQPDFRIAGLVVGVVRRY
jgi:repressor LexA